MFYKLNTATFIFCKKKQKKTAVTKKYIIINTYVFFWFVLFFGLVIKHNLKTHFRVRFSFLS